MDLVLKRLGFIFFISFDALATDSYKKGLSNSMIWFCMGHFDNNSGSDMYAVWSKVLNLSFEYLGKDDEYDRGFF